MSAAWRAPGRVPEPRVVDGTFWHQGPVRLAADHLVHPARYAARFRKPGGPGTWYASSSEAAAWAELARHAPDLPLTDLRPRRVCKVRVRALPVVDLLDVEAPAVLGLGAPALISDEADDLAVLADMAAWAHAEGFGGILTPSAALIAAITLVVFSSGMHAVAVESERIADPPA